MTSTQLIGIAMVTFGVFVLVCCIVSEYLKSSARHEAQVRRHHAKRHLELQQHRFEAGRDAAGVRREISNELHGRRR
jgi:hypothetical protein